MRTLRKSVTLLVLVVLLLTSCGTSSPAKQGAEKAGAVPVVSLNVGHAFYSDSVPLIVYSPDGNYFASSTRGNKDDLIKIWDARSDVIIASLTVKLIWDAVYHMEWSPDGRKLHVYTGSDGCRIYEAFTGKYIADSKVKPNELSVRSPNGRYTAVSSGVANDDKQIVSISASGRQISSYSVDSKYLYSLRFSPDSSQLFIEGSDGLAHIVNPANGETIDMIDRERRDYLMNQTHDDVRAVNWSQDGSRILATVWGRDKGAYVWNTATASVDSASPSDMQFYSVDLPQLQQSGLTFRLHSIAQNKDGTLAVGMLPFGWLQTYSAGKRISSVLTLPAGYDRGRIKKLAYSPNGRQLLVMNGGNELGKLTVEIWDPAGRRTVSLISEAETIRTTEMQYDAAWSPDGTQVAAAGDKSVKVWNAASGAVLMSFNVDKHTMCLAFTPNGKQLLVGDENGMVRLLDVPTGRVARTFSGLEDRIVAITMSPDSKQVLALDSTGQLKVWDAESGNEIKTLQTGKIKADPWKEISVAFSPDANRVVFISPDNMIRVVHIPSGKGATLAVYTSGDWAAIADEGVSFNSSGNYGKYNINIISGNKALPRDSYDSMNDPELLKAILTGKPSEQLTAIWAREGTEKQAAERAALSKEQEAATKELAAAALRAPQKGSYSFRPPLSAQQEGGSRTVSVRSVYVYDKRNLNLYMDGNPQITRGTLQNLDHPDKSFNSTSSEVSEDSGSRFLRFNGVVGRRFSLTLYGPSGEKWFYPEFVMEKE
jgi:WD40 repeat protein